MAETFALARRVLVSRSCERGLTLDDVAAAVYVSPRTLQRCFSAHNTSFQRELRDARVLWAQDVLQFAPDFDFTELAFRVGFRAGPRLNEALRAVLGCTPSDLRRHAMTAALAHDQAERGVRVTIAVWGLVGGWESSTAFTEWAHACLTRWKTNNRRYLSDAVGLSGLPELAATHPRSLRDAASPFRST